MLELRDSIKMKSNVADPHTRTVVIPEVHRLLFAGAFSSRFLKTEKSIQGIDLKQSSPKFNLTIITRVSEVFQDSVAKFHGSGDVTLITPWYTLKNNMNIANTVLSKGTLILPIITEGTTLKCFLPCAGLDPDTDQVPSWGESYVIKDIVPKLKPEQMYPIRQQGIGKMSAIKNTDCTSIPSGQVDEGDIIVCRGQWMIVYAFGDDAFYKEGVHDVVRFTKDFEKNINKQKFEIMKRPTLQGKVLELNQSDLELNEPVSTVLSKINQHSIGSLKTTYRNACFNSFGFMTHDTHILQ